MLLSSEVGLTLKGGAGPTWYPVSIKRFEALLSKVIVAGYGYPHVYALKRNVAYSLQYLEYLHQCLSDLKLSGVIEAQTRKSITLISASVIESLIYYLLIKRDEYTKTEWSLKAVVSGNQKKVGNHNIKIDSHIYTKLPAFKLDHMTFDAMIKKAAAKKLFGVNKTVYSDLDLLRKLRNKIHLQEISFSVDTDWNTFTDAEHSRVRSLLHAIVTSNIFRPSAEEKQYFTYLLDSR